VVTGRNNGSRRGREGRYGSATVTVANLVRPWRPPRLLLHAYVERAAFFAGLNGEFEQADGAESVFRRDGRRGFAEDSVAHIGVEVSVVAQLGGELRDVEVCGLCWVRSERERSPGRFGFGKPRRRAAERRRKRSGDNRRFLQVEAVFHEAAASAVNGKPWCGDGGDHG
jgi:hypothetical protein